MTTPPPQEPAKGPVPPPPWERPDYQYGQFLPPEQPYAPPAYPPQPGQYPPPYQPPNPGQYPPQYAGYPPMAPVWPSPVDTQAPTPGIIPLRRSGLDAGDIIGGVVASYRRDWRTLLGLSALVNGMSLIVQFAIGTLGVIWLLPGIRAIGEWDSTSGPTQAQFRAFLSQVVYPALPLVVLYLIITICARAVLSGLIAVVLAEDSVGNRIGIAAAIAGVRPVLGRLLLQGLLLSFGLAVGFVCCIVPGVWLFGIWAVATPALVLERGTPTGAIGRSQRLVSGMFWRVLGIRLLGVFSGAVVSYLIGIPFNVANPTGSGSAAALGTVLFWLGIALLGQFVASVLTAPIGASFQALLYLDARMRKESLAEQMRAHVAPLMQ